MALGTKFPYFRLMKTTTKLAAVLALSAASANGAVMVLDFGTNINNDDSAITDTELGNLVFTGASKLVVTVGVKGSGLSPDNQAGNVTYNNEPMLFVTGSAGTGSSAYGWVGIYYLDNPGSVGVGDLVVQDPGYSLGVSALVLSGTAAGFGDTASSKSATTVSVTTTSADSLVLAGYSDGSSSAVAASPLTGLVFADGGTFGSGNHAAGYQLVGAASTITPTFTTSGARPSTVAAEFTAVPEPSVALLGALGALALIRRRR